MVYRRIRLFGRRFTVLATACALLSAVSLGTMGCRPTSQPTQTSVVGSSSAQVPASAAPGLVSDSRAQVPAASDEPAPPASPEEVPVGDGQPRLWIGELDPTRGYSYDLGTIAADQIAEQVFTLMNVGKAPLTIIGVTATCGCTVPTVEDLEVPAGGSTLLRVTYDPRTNGEQGMAVEKEIMIRSNDPVVPFAIFAITAQVAPQ